MASIAIMIGGAVVNAASFIGGNYLARYLSGDDPKAAQEEKVRHDLPGLPGGLPGGLC